MTTEPTPIGNEAKQAAEKIRNSRPANPIYWHAHGEDAAIIQRAIDASTAELRVKLDASIASYECACETEAAYRKERDALRARLEEAEDRAMEDMRAALERIEGNDPAANFQDADKIANVGLARLRKGGEAICPKCNTRHSQKCSDGFYCDHCGYIFGTLEQELTDLRSRLDIAKVALKSAYARGHYCDLGDQCPGCMAGYALEKITGRKWTQEECE